MSELLPVGSIITYMGRDATIAAVGITGGERYYWLTLGSSGVAMIPACVLEPYVLRV